MTGRAFEAGHRHHHFQAGEGARACRWHESWSATLVAGVHRLEHVQGLGAAYFADDDAVGPHAQAVANQVRW